ncbi:TPA: hypothetical protein ACH3X1_003487 [Trebouxia sp. C0004]
MHVYLHQEVTGRTTPVLVCNSRILALRCHDSQQLYCTLLAWSFSTKSIHCSQIACQQLLRLALCLFWDLTVTSVTMYHFTSAGTTVWWSEDTSLEGNVAAHNLYCCLANLVAHLNVTASPLHVFAKTFLYPGKSINSPQIGCGAFSILHINILLCLTEFWDCLTVLSDATLNFRPALQSLHQACSVV